MNIDPSSHVPIYLQIADAVRAAVAAGVYRSGEVLPSLRAMAIKLHVNPNTVQRAVSRVGAGRADLFATRPRSVRRRASRRRGEVDCWRRRSPACLTKPFEPDNWQA